jgi:hypothetical protein
MGGMGRIGGQGLGGGTREWKEVSERVAHWE